MKIQALTRFVFGQNEYPPVDSHLRVAVPKRAKSAASSLSEAKLRAQQAALRQELAAKEVQMEAARAAAKQPWGD